MLSSYVRLNAKMLASSAFSVPTSAMVAGMASVFEPHVAATFTLLWAYLAWYGAFTAFSILERRRASKSLRSYFACMGAPLLAGEAVFASMLWSLYYLALTWGYDPAAAYLVVNAGAYAAFLGVVNAVTRLDVAGRFKSHGAASTA